jgi:nucleotide-binding universal stress UspA family protein
MRAYKHILVPLDGSQMAEVALPHALELARLCNAEVTLLVVIPPILEIIETDAEPIYVDEQVRAREASALRYLNSIRERLAAQAVRVRTAVEIGGVAGEILDFAATQSTDIIVMATHGRSGLKRWLLGSVAEKIVHASRHPVLLVRAFAE